MVFVVHFLLVAVDVVGQTSFLHQRGGGQLGLEFAQFRLIGEQGHLLGLFALVGCLAVL